MTQIHSTPWKPRAWIELQDKIEFSRQFFLSMDEGPDNRKKSQLYRSRNPDRVRSKCFLRLTKNLISKG